MLVGPCSLFQRASFFIGWGLIGKKNSSIFAVLEEFLLTILKAAIRTLPFPLGLRYDATIYRYSRQTAGLSEDQRNGRVAVATGLFGSSSFRD
jgi:hypothetical protein